MADMVHHIGETTITIHSPSEFLALAPDEKHHWFQREYEAGNAVLKRIVELVSIISSCVGTNEKQSAGSDAYDEGTNM